MSLVGLKKNQVKSAILCEDRDFKRKSIMFLNNAAFSGEKFQTENVAATLDLIVRDSMVRNIVIDSRIFSDAALEPALQQVMTVVKNLPVRVLCYLQDHQHSLEIQLKEAMPSFHFAFAPLSQAVFNKSFIIKRDTEKDQDEAKSGQKSSPKQPARSVIEASIHLKDTVDLLNQFSADKNKREALQAVGQKFNGLVGAFAFLQDQAGYKSLCSLAQIIDEICRHYENQHTEVHDNHWSLIKEAAKCAYLLLRDMREQTPTEALNQWITKEAELSQSFSTLADIQKREQLDQNAVDTLLEDIQKKSG
ncbi:MAG: hypothetical protein ACOH5I_17890 [Oligoflexus sp.]